MTTRNSPATTNNGGITQRLQGTIRVLGIDPGSLATGYGVIEWSRRGVQLLTCGTITNRPETPLPRRLLLIFREITALLRKYHPDEFAIESAFTGRNAQSALKLGHVRGVCLLAAEARGVPVTGYAPREVKLAVVGNGAGAKEQVRYMVASLLHQEKNSFTLDTSDALAVALCHVQRMGKPTSRPRDWSAYVKAHPERVRS